MTRRSSSDDASTCRAAAGDGSVAEDLGTRPRARSDGSVVAAGETGRGDPRDESRAAAGHVAGDVATCAWCEGPIPMLSEEGRARRRDSVFCRKRCRQTAWRLEAHGVVRGVCARAIRVAYADPPYPGLARRYYDSEEVDHRELVARLVRDFPDGWALSTGAYALREVLPLCPAGVRVCAWTKPHGAHVRGHGIQNVWEPLIVCGGRQRPPGVRDTLSTHAARGGGTLPGRKPRRYVEWLFALLGIDPRLGDELEDLFPGTGIVTRAFRELGRRTA
jgi:hypothetical protein